MITNARWGMWETNSSSCHQIILRDDGEYKVPKSIRMYTAEYGWGWGVLRTVEERLSYMLTCLMYEDAWRSYADADDALEGEDSETKFDRHVERIKKFLMENGVEEIIDLEPGDDWNSKYNIKHLNGYVDHGDEYLPKILEILNDDKELKDFLFNGKTIITLGNDNEDCPPPSFNYEEEISKEIW